MGINLGLLGRIASQGYGGYQKGLISAESETYKRKQEKEQQDREIAHQALMETLAQSQDTREAGKYSYDLSQRPVTEAKAAADLTHETAETAHLNAPEQPEWQKQGYASFTDWQRDKVNGTGDRRPEWQKQGYKSFNDWRHDKETSAQPVVDPAKERSNYIKQHLPERTKPRVQRDPLSGQITVLPGDSPASAYKALSEEYDLIQGGKVPDEAQARSSQNRWGEHERPPASATGWQPTDARPGRSTAAPEAPEVQPSDTLSGQMPHESGNLPPLEADDLARAQTDPGFKDFLRSQGYTVP